ncbi:UNVERIFIED_CONTAM: hypothetical protein Sradi_1538500 [Sesamum radiatum]|uniref:Uncharacterized protein n=1 Tax=Sesamum radiatum TaxID=300843 RepID=A0AAW2U8D8_SESRA
MAILQPSSLSQAFGLPRLLEAKFQNSKKPPSAPLLPRPFPTLRPLRPSLLFHATLLPWKCWLAVLVGDRGSLFRNQLSGTELTKVALGLRSSDEVVFYLTLFLSL